MNSTKILIVTSEFPPQPGGIGNHALNLATQLQLNRYQVGVVADERSKHGLEEQQFDVKLPFEVYRIKRHPVSLVTYIKRILILKKVAKEYSILFASGKFPLWLIGFFPFKNKKLKLAVIHGSEVNLKGLFKKFTDKALLKFDKIIAVSNFTKSFIDHLNITNCNVIPNGFMISSIYEKTGLKKEDPILITVGSVSERKGQMNIIKALPTLRKIYPTIQYHIVGIPTEQPTFEKEASALNVLDCITFYGKVSEEKKQELLQESDLFIMLSNTTSTGDVEGFGIAILEANAMGLPAIGSLNCGIEEAIFHENSGLLVSPKDSQEICNAVQLIWNDYGRYQKNAIAWSYEFRWEKIIKQYITLLNV